MENQFENHLAALVSSQAPDTSPRSEWMRIRQIVKHYNLSRSFIYELLRQGILRSVSLRKKGNIRGIRLVSRISMDEYLAALAAHQKGGK